MEDAVNQKVRNLRKYSAPQREAKRSFLGWNPQEGETEVMNEEAQGEKRFYKLRKSDSVPECQLTIRALEKLTVHFFGVIVRQGAATQERLQKCVMSFLQFYHCLPSGWKRIVFPNQVNLQVNAATDTPLKEPEKSRTCEQSKTKTTFN